MLLAAAEKRLGAILRVKVDELLAAPDAALLLGPDENRVPTISWDSVPVATLHSGQTLVAPEIRLDRSLLALGQDVQKRVADRLTAWITVQKERHLLPLVKMAAAASDPDVPPVVRAVFAQLADAGGIIERTEIDASLAHLDKDQRYVLRKSGITVGVLDIFHSGLLKPGAALWRMALISARKGKPMLPLPPAGATLLALEGREVEMGARIAGFRGFGPQFVRIDMAERMARAAHETIAKSEPFHALDPRIVSLGLLEPAFLQLMRAAGFRPVEAAEGGPNWAFRGRQKARTASPKPQGRNGDARPAAKPAATPSASPSAGSAFAGLAELLGRNG